MQTRLLTLGHSPDPDDAFMFYALAKELIPTGPYRFQHILQDIQTLNERATRGELDISAISIHAYAYVSSQYALLPSGASMGDGYGPMLVAKQKYTREEIRGRAALSERAASATGASEKSDPSTVKNLSEKDSPSSPISNLKSQISNSASSPTTQSSVLSPQSSSLKIAVPGTMTSAFLALQLYLDLPAAELNYIVVPFDQIFQSVRSGAADIGLIIHEGQLTYRNEGLELCEDLGIWWGRQNDGLPLPLGGNVIHKRFPESDRAAIARILEASIRYSLEHRPEAVQHALQYARDMGKDLADKFVGMYVNHWTLDYGDKGRESIRRFLHQAHARSLIPHKQDLEFVR